MIRPSFDPSKFLDLANSLAMDSRYESDARARTAIGRIYYATFLLALQKLQAKGISVQDPEKIHQFVIETFKERGLHNIGDGLNKLREKRIDADYHMTTDITLDMCKKYSRFSEYVIRLLEQVKEIRRA